MVLHYPEHIIAKAASRIQTRWVGVTNQGRKADVLLSVISTSCLNTNKCFAPGSYLLMRAANSSR